MEPKGDVGSNKTNKSFLSKLHLFITSIITSDVLDVSVANDLSLKKGTDAPHFSPISAISLLSVDNMQSLINLFSLANWMRQLKRNFLFYLMNL